MDLVLTVFSSSALRHLMVLLKLHLVHCMFVSPFRVTAVLEHSLLIGTPLPYHERMLFSSNVANSPFAS